MYDDNATHEGIIYTIVARNSWQVFLSCIREVKKRSHKYKTNNGVNGIPFPVFCNYVKCICVDTEDNIEQKELYFWCLSHKIM